MAENKTRETTVDAAAFLDAVPHPGRRADGKALCAMMERLSGEPPRMWGPTIVGFGRCRYRYESGREGEMPRIGFSPRAKELVLYLTDEFEGHAGLMARLGRHRTGKSCLYIGKLADVDAGVLEELIAKSIEAVNAKYPSNETAA